MKTQKSILFLAPQLYGSPGGVQTYMRRLREILTIYSKIRGFRVHCISLVDAREERELHPPRAQQGTFMGCAGKKLIFVLNAFGCTTRHSDTLMVVGHLGQAPVALVLKKLGLIQSYILVLHGIEAWDRATWLDRQAARGASCIVATTQYTACEFGKHNDISIERFRIIPVSLAEEKIDPPPDNQGNIGEIRVSTVARLSSGDRDKGIDTLIQAVAKVRSNGLRVHLTVVGDGDDLRRLKEMAMELGLDSQTASFLGFVSDKKLQSLYKECDVFALPSKKEGFGIVFLEAMRFAKPCIGGNHGGLPEVITHGVDG